MAQKSLVDIKNFIENKWTENVGKQLNVYEKKMKEVVKDLDLKSRDAREKSREQLDGFTRQIKKARTDLEKRIVTLVNQESKRLNVGLNDLVHYLKSLAHSEKNGAVAAAPEKTKIKAKKKAKATVLKASSLVKSKKPVAKTKLAKTVKKAAKTAGGKSVGGANSSVSSSLSH